MNDKCEWEIVGKDDKYNVFYVYCEEKLKMREMKEILKNCDYYGKEIEEVKCER